MLKNSILFAWSRKPENVIFTDASIKKIYEVTTSLSEKYGVASSVPIVSPADQRNKVARLSCALAALLNSIDNENVVLKPAHVEFIFMYLTAIYDTPACSLNYLNKLVVKEEQIDDEKFDKIKKFIKVNNPQFDDDIDFNNLVITFAKQISMNLNDIEAMLNMTKEQTKILTQSLSKAGLLVRTSHGFKKTVRFNYFINKFCELGGVSAAEETDIF